MGIPPDSSKRHLTIQQQQQRNKNITQTIPKHNGIDIILQVPAHPMQQQQQQAISKHKMGII